MRILALDPGRTTGVAYFPDTPSGTPNVEQRELPYSHKALYNHLRLVNPDIIVCESFVYQRRDKVDLSPVEMIGVVKLYCERGGVPYHEQTPSQAKKFWDDKKIKTCGLWVPGHPHAVDAIRHLLYFMTFTINDNRWMKMIQDARSE